MDLVTELRALLAKDRVLTDPQQTRVYESDGLTAYRRIPRVVVLPNDVTEVQAVMRLCHRLQVPVVARGAGTGLSGGALPHAEGVLLSLAKLNRIVSLDAKNRVAVVEPGVRNLAVSEAAAALGLYYAPDPSSQIACSIGGNIAENSGGVHCLKYGLTVHNVLAVKMVLASGELVSLGSQALDAPGLDLLSVCCGSEGLLGVVVQATLRLLPVPQQATVLMAAFATVEAAGEAVAAIIGAGIIPAGLEMMDALAVEAAEAFAHAGYPTNAAAILLCELDGSSAEVEADVARVDHLLRQHGARSVQRSNSEQERQQMWKGRKSAFPAVGRLAPDYYCMDGTIPRRHLARALRTISELSVEFGLRVANVFHAGDGNLHPLILYDANKPGELKLAEALGARILEASVALGGTITGEHGVGVEKIDQMCVQFGMAELTQFHRLKQAFDERGLLNPGKAVPSLHRCAELGRMHVHVGADGGAHVGTSTHPELPRF